MMNLYNYLDKLECSSHAAIEKQLIQQILELQKIEYINSVLHVCDALKEQMPSEFRGEPFQFKLHFLPAHNFFYNANFNYCGEHDDLKKFYNDVVSYSVKGIFKIINEETVKKMYWGKNVDSLNITIKFNNEGLKILQEELMGSRLSKEYSTVIFALNLDSQLDNKDKIIKNKI